MQLIDVLKKQKVHLMASTIFKYCEEDFTKLLEINNQWYYDEHFLVILHINYTVKMHSISSKVIILDLVYVI